MTGFTYKDAGVDLDLNQQAMAKLPPLMQRTHTPGVLDLPGGFAGLYRLLGDGIAYDDPVLVSGTDGVGTKIKVAMLAERYDTIGIDLVAMCANDCLCLGARPLFFLDYIAMHHDDPPLLAALVEGVSEGCVQAGAALLGGETAIMSDLYTPGEFDLAGFCVGVAERSQLVDNSRIAAGDKLVGIASSGLHSNGFSLVRKVVFEAAGLDVNDTVDALGTTVAEALLEPTRIYAKPVLGVLGDHRDGVHGMAHITGGGLDENLARLLPDGLGIRIDASSWTPPPVFDWLADLGPVPRDEMFRVFNMGLGYVMIVASDEADAVRDRVAAEGLDAWIVGEVGEGDRHVEIVAG